MKWFLQVVDYIFPSLNIKKTLLFLYISGELSFKIQNEKCLEPQCPSCVFLFILNLFPPERVNGVKFLSTSQIMYIYVFRIRVTKNSALGLYETIFPLYWFTAFNSPQQRLIWENVNLQESNLCSCCGCLLTTVCPTTSLRRKTCVLWRSDGVFLMAPCLVGQ